MILRKREQQRLRANSNASRGTINSHNTNATSNSAPNPRTTAAATAAAAPKEHVNTIDEPPPSSISITSSSSSATGPPPRKNSGALRSALTHYDHAVRTPSPLDTDGAATGATAAATIGTNGEQGASATGYIKSDDSSQDGNSSKNGSAVVVTTTSTMSVGGGSAVEGGYQQRDRSSTLEQVISMRDRSSTFGSDFDLGFGFGSLSSPVHEEMDTATTASGATAAIGGASGEDVGAAQTAAAASAVVSMGTLPSVGATTASTGTAEEMVAGDARKSSAGAATATGGMEGIPTTIMHHRHQPPPPQSQPPTQQQQQQQRTANNNNTTPNNTESSSQESIESSTSGFLSGYFGQSPPQPPASSATTEAPASSAARPIHPNSTAKPVEGSTATTTTQKIMIQNSNSTNSSKTTVAHTPPSALGSSYEARHFGKRPRAGSISGRLRSASDLEDMGLIDREQKGIVKDLIISGDDALQMALDRYEMGDTSELEGMIKSGALNNRSSDVDILGDLDLDFLTVNDDFGDLIMGAANVSSNNAPQAAPSATPAGAAPPTATTNTTSNPAGIPVRSKSMSIPVKQDMSDAPHQPQSAHGVTRAASMPHTMISQIPTGESSYVDDGIGDLEFNGTYPGGEEYLSLPTESGSHVTQADGVQPAQPQQPQQAQGSDQQRFRANSLAFGGLLEDTSSGEGHHTYGQWMDRHPADGETAKKHHPPHKSKSTSNIVGANGGLYIVKNGNDMNRLNSGYAYTTKQPIAASHVRPNMEGGIGATLKNLTKNEICETASTLNRLEQMAERRREKQEKREQKEREKQEKREQRERAKQEKKEREAREKQLRKEKKAAATKAKQEKKKLEGLGTNASKAQYDKRGKNPSKEEGDEDEERKEVPSGLGMPRSLSDPNLTVGLDSNGLMHVDRPDGWVGAYSPESRKIRIERFMEKRNHRVWTKKVKYDVRKNFADSRLRVKGRFVKKEDELLMRDLMSLT